MKIPTDRIIILLFAVLLGFVSCKKDDPPAITNMYMGALLPLTGSGASVGESANAAIELAVEDINSQLIREGKDTQLVVFVEDTETDPDVALQKLGSLKEKNVDIIVGPFTSANVSAVKDYADVNDLLIVSPASVSTSLAIADDNIYRLVPSDYNQGEAVSAMLKDDGIEVLIPIIRDDIWGNELLEATKNNFTGSDTYVNEAVKYPTNSDDFTNYLEALKTNLETTLNTHPAQKVGVSLLAYGESVEILKLASQDSVFTAVRWYGSSGFAGTASLPSDTLAAAFALNQHLSCPTFALDNVALEQWKPIYERLGYMLERTPEIYAYTTYDAIWLAAETILAAESTADFNSLKQSFENSADTTFGITGNTAVNAAGDRAYAAYDFWGLQNSLGQYIWEIQARYNNATGILERY